jgi:hypothetical protein
MKTIILITTVFLSQLSLAGTGGGGVMMKTMSSKQPQIVYNIGKQDGLVHFAYGQLVDKQWQIQKLEIPEADLMANIAVVKALQDSESQNDWIELK